MPPEVGLSEELPAGTDSENMQELVGKNHGLSDPSGPKNGPAWPEETIGKSPLARLKLEIQRWTYSYMSELLWKGSKQTLDDGTRLREEDLFRLPKEMESAYLVSKFNEYYLELKGDKRRLVKTLWRLSKTSFVPAGFCQLATVLCQIAMPLFVRELLRVLDENPGQKVIKEGIPYAIGIFFALLFNALGNHRHRHLATKTGVVLRSAVIGVIYDRALRLSPRGKSGLTSGEVTTLVAIDTQKLYEVTQEAHLTWSMPLSMTLVTICLVAIMGPTTLVGLAVLIMFVPIVERIASRMLSYRHRRVKVTDRRVEIVSAMLQGIKVTKLNSYEENYRDRIEKAREEEHNLLKGELAWWGCSLVVTVTSPMLASAGTFATYVLVDEDNVLTTAQTFTVLLLFIALRFPISYTGRLIGKAAQAIESVRRIDDFVCREVRTDPPEQTGEVEVESLDNHDPSVLTVENGIFRVGQTDDRTLSESLKGVSAGDIGFEVSGINLSLKRGQVMAVVGPVGSGKSTLINGIIGEVTASPSTHISSKGSVAYVSQTAFIMNATLRNNILFGVPFDADWYSKVLDACCLRPDLEQLGESGDMTEIGERGVTLSGGQKQRVSLARAAYARPDLVLMDDPISALDAGTSKKIFDRLIQSPTTSILSNSAIVLVTHAAHFLNRVNQIMVVVEGKARFVGSWTELSSFKSEDVKTKEAIDFICASVQEAAGHGGDDDNAKSKDPSASNDQDGTDEREIKGKLMTVEEREHGLSSLRTWLLWFKYAGGIPFVLVQLSLMCIDRFAYVASEYWLARWTQGAYEPLNVLGMEFPAQTDGYSAQFQYLKVYSIILLFGAVFTFLRSEWAVTGGARCSRDVFLAMLAHVLKAPVSYFETTPLGRILNRFTYDMEVIDLTLTESMSILMIATSWFLAGVIIMLTILPWIGIALIPGMVAYYLLLLHYRKSGTDLQRIDAVARSPIQAMVAEGLEGSTTIRVFRQVESFISTFFTTSDKSASALLNFISAQRWLGVRIEVMGSFIVLCACLLVISMNDILELPSGIVALLIIWCTNFTVTLGFLVDYFAEGEAAITSIERVDAMVTIPQEKPMLTEPDHQPDKTWPSQGLLEFDEVCLRYRYGLPLALNKLSFTIPPGKRCGVVGRTGAGKSSLTAALFRLVEVEAGRILLDGVDLGKIGLSDVRGRANGMVIIPQDPFIAGTTLRECLDPFGVAADEHIVEALVSVRLAKSLSDLSVLDNKVAEGGSNFSVGERQLLNLARALLFKPKLLILDEATASIDGETDAFIQRMLRTRFQDTTLVTVAHRLNTIMDYDTILVMDAGRAAEMGPPLELLDKNGMFAELVNATGVESARALRDIAEAAEK